MMINTILIIATVIWVIIAIYVIWWLGKVGNEQN